MSPVVGGFPGGSDCKESAYDAGDLGSIPGLGRSLGGGHGSPSSRELEASLVAQLVKCPPAMQEALLWFLGW